MLIPFESLTLAKESTPGTAIAAPTHYSHIKGTLITKDQVYEPEESDGSLARSGEGRQKKTREWGEFSGDGPLDTDGILAVMDASVKGGISNSTPSGATDARLWEFVPSVGADDINFYTFFFGDPNMSSVLRAPYGIIKSWGIESNASAGEGVKFSMSGITAAPTKFTTPTYPSYSAADLLAAMEMDVWLDSGASAIGTTSITTRVSQMSVALETNVVPVYFAVGAGGTITYNQHGRLKRQISMSCTVDFSDFTDWDLFKSGVPIKLRARFSGAEIETGFRNYVEVDGYGLPRHNDYGDLEGARRLIKFELKSATDSTLGADFRVAVQNELETI